MNAVLLEAPSILSAFLLTLQLFALAAVGSLGLGVLVASMNVSPIPPLRWAAQGYIRVIRNTPLTVVFFLVVFGLPQLEIRLPYFTFALVALILYSATFVAEVLRSGINAVPIGQVEAARSLGLPFGKVLGKIVLPQAARSVVPPMTSVMISLFKNTSVASAFGVFEAIATMTSLVNKHSSSVLWIMAATAALYILIAYVFGTLAAWFERRVEVKR